MKLNEQDRRKLEKQKSWQYAKNINLLRFSPLGGEKKKTIMAVGETRKAIFRPTPCLKERPFDSSGFSTEGDLNLRVRVAP